MKKLICVMALLMVAAVLSSSAYAADKYAGEFLNIGVGGRALAMGGAYVGLANDGTAMYWNPAGMGSVYYKEAYVMASPASLESTGGDTLGMAQLGASYYYGGLVWSLGQTKVGFGYLQLSIADIYDTRGLGYDDANSSGDWEAGERVYYDGDYLEAHKDTSNSTAMFFSVARNFGPSLSVGANVKKISESIFEYDGNGMGVDFGVMYRMNPGNPMMGQQGSGLSVGLVVRNVTNTPIAWTTDTASSFYRSSDLYTENVSLADPTDASIPLNITGGAAFTLAGSQAFSLTLAGSINMVESGMDLGFGTEIMIANMLALRAGLTQLAGATSELNTMSLSGGMGLKIANMAQVDYVLTGFGSTLTGDAFANSLGAAHRISLSFRF